MHVLTKVFIVLVALLAVMLVPLVVVYAKNENNYKARYMQADQDRAASEQAAQRAQLTLGTETQKLQNTVDQLRDEIGDLQRALAEKNATAARLQAELATSQQTLAHMSSKISTIDSRLDSGQTLIEELVRESGELRDQALALERVNAELESHRREQARNLEVAESAVRSLQEEVARLSDANAEALDRLGRIIQRYPEAEEAMTGVTGSTPITTKVTASVLDVRQQSGVTMVEIDAGQRDGVKVGWEMTLGDADGNYVGRLRIVSVDMNRATGIAERPGGGQVDVSLGYRAVAFPQ